MSRRESTAVTYRQLQKRKSNSDHSVTVGKQTKGDLLHAVYRYSRAYVLKGTGLSIISISLLAIKSLSDITPSFLYGVLQAIIGGCLANLYVVGVNQLSDIEIDKVNKPYLPLASGELSVKTAIRITSLYAILGFCLILSVKSWHLKLCIFLWYAVGTAYSVHLPLLRWKKHHVLVAMCSWLFQGVLFSMLFHLHAQTSIHGGPLVLSKHAIFVFGIMGIHCTVLVIFKDIPDVEGDKRNGINSFPSRFGQKRVFWICIGLLETIYGIAVLVGLSSNHLWIRQIMVLGHSLLGFIVWRKANLVDLKSNEAIESFYLFIWKVLGHSLLGFIVWRKANLVDLKSNEAIESFYLFIWKLYYVEYLLVPILRF